MSLIKFKVIDFATDDDYVKVYVKDKCTDKTLACYDGKNSIPKKMNDCIVISWDFEYKTKTLSLYIDEEEERSKDAFFDVEE